MTPPYLDDPMVMQLTITAKGQITLRQAALDHLGLKPGDKVEVSLLQDGKVELMPAGNRHRLSSLRGRLHRADQASVPLEAMQAAIEVGRLR